MENLNTSEEHDADINMGKTWRKRVQKIRRLGIIWLRTKLGEKSQKNKTNLLRFIDIIY